MGTSCSAPHTHTWLGRWELGWGVVGILHTAFGGRLSSFPVPSYHLLEDIITSLSSSLSPRRFLLPLPALACMCFTFYRSGTDTMVMHILFLAESGTVCHIYTPFSPCHHHVYAFLSPLLLLSLSPLTTCLYALPSFSISHPSPLSSSTSPLPHLLSGLDDFGTTHWM